MAGRGGDFQVNLAKLGFNTVNKYCRRLEFGEQSTTFRSRETGVERRGTKRKQSKIRFRQRKHTCRPDRKFCSKRGSRESSEEEIVRYNWPKILPAASGDSKQKTSEFHAVLNKLHPLRDSGNWKEFNSVADGFTKAKEGDLDLELLVLIEKSVAVSYQNDLENAKAMVRKALKTLNETEVKMHMRNFLVTMAHLHLTGFYRRQNKHGEAEGCIAEAEQYYRDGSSRYLKALIFYEMASNRSKYASSIPLSQSSARERYVEQAKQHMNHCIDLCIELDTGSVYIKKHHFGLVKLALLDLNCRTKAARITGPRSTCIKEAKNRLKTVEEKYKDEMKEGQKIQFFVAQCDLNYREGNLKAALEHAHSALDHAKDNGFNLEIAAIKERQDEISKLITTKETMNLNIPQSDEGMETLSSSTGPSRRNSPHSSGCEMEKYCYRSPAGISQKLFLKELCKMHAIICMFNFVMCIIYTCMVIL